MGADGKDTGTGGRQPTGLRDVLQVGGAGGSSIRVGDMGDDPLHGKCPMKFPALGPQKDYREAAKTTGGWELEVPTAGYSNVGGGV